ncbi:hypothetical protein EON82_05930 [bacterium]|nr:MAG: hypothetical protein EON82_05930 [bacterium]
MPSRFEEDPTLLTPEVAVRVVERFAARQREQDADATQSAGMTHAQELADLLGTTPEDVLRLAEESRPVAQPKVEPVVAPRPQWPFHIAYLSAIGLALLVAMNQVAGTTPSTQAQVVTAPPAPVVTEPSPPVVAPLFEGTNWQEREIPILGNGVILPPAGVKVRLAEQWGKPTMMGPPGTRVDDEMSRATLRTAIQSLLKHTEKSEVSKFADKKIDFREVPKDLLNAELPLIVGWHRIEAFSGGHFFSALVPDMRFAKDARAAQRLLDREVERLVRQVLKE